MLSEMNAYIIGRQKRKDDHHDDDSGAGSDSNGEESGSDENTKVKSKGTLILDATCAPADIKFPTDISLLNAGRESMETIIADLHTALADGEKKPRTYKNRARKEYLRFARNRKPTIKVIRKAIKKQLGYLCETRPFDC